MCVCDACVCVCFCVCVFVFDFQLMSQPTLSHLAEEAGFIQNGTISLLGNYHVPGAGSARAGPGLALPPSLPPSSRSTTAGARLAPAGAAGAAGAGAGAAAAKAGAGRGAGTAAAAGGAAAAAAASRRGPTSPPLPPPSSTPSVGLASPAGRNSGKGLRLFSLKVCQQVQKRGKTTYKEVADALVQDYEELKAADTSGTVRRGVGVCWLLLMCVRCHTLM